MKIIWHILLTVCMDGECRTQDVQWFDTEKECVNMLVQYQNIPQDRNWQTVDYICKPLNASAV